MKHVERFHHTIYSTHNSLPVSTGTFSPAKELFVDVGGLTDCRSLFWNLSLSLRFLIFLLLMLTVLSR